MASYNERKCNAVENVLTDMNEYPPELILARRMHLDGITVEQATKWLWHRYTHLPLMLRYRVWTFFMDLSTNTQGWADDVRLEYLAINLVMDKQKKGKVKKRPKNSFFDAME